jgi:hypothetical protein
VPEAFLSPPESRPCFDRGGFFIDIGVSLRDDAEAFLTTDVRVLEWRSDPVIPYHAGYFVGRESGRVKLMKEKLPAASQSDAVFPSQPCTARSICAARVVKTGCITGL